MTQNNFNAVLIDIFHHMLSRYEYYLDTNNNNNINKDIININNFLCNKNQFHENELIQFQDSLLNFIESNQILEPSKFNTIRSKIIFWQENYNNSTNFFIQITNELKSIFNINTVHSNLLNKLNIYSPLFSDNNSLIIVKKPYDKTYIRNFFQEIETLFEKVFQIEYLPNFIINYQSENFPIVIGLVILLKI